MRVSGTPFSSVEQLRAIDAALQVAPNDARLRFERARCLDDLGRGDEAARAYRGLLDSDPRHFGALTNLGTLLLEQDAREGASLCFYAALANGWDDPLAHLNVALINAQTEAFDAARLHYERVLQLFADDAHARLHAHNGLARVYERLHDEARAAHHRAEAFAAPIVWTFPARETDTPARVLVLTSPRGGDMITNQFFDDRVVARTVIVPESFGPAVALPPHHAIFNAIGEADSARSTLEAAAGVVARSAAPVINDPRAVLLTDRERMMERLAPLPGLIAPRTRRIRRADLTAERLAEAGFTFPLLVRSPGFHAGGNFERVAEAADLPATLRALPGDELYAIAYHDARGADGWVRKYRVAFIDGEPYPIHLAIGAQWKVHYFSAAMSDSPEHRAEERRFLDDMPAVLGARGMETLAAIAATLGLDYGGIDFGRDPSGTIVVFEANATMAIYTPPDDPRWDYRRPAHRRAIAAVHAMVLARAIRGGFSPQ